MDSLEIKKELDMSYEALVDYLHAKYGKVEHDYFEDETCSRLNKNVSRINEGLFCHHIDEDKAIMLSSSNYALKNPFEYQMADRLVYCNILEHLMLHIKIVLEPKHPEANEEEDQGIGGIINFMAKQINDYFNGYQYKRKYYIKVFSLIDNNFDDYIGILRYFFYEYSFEKSADYIWKLKNKASRGYYGNIVETVYKALIDADLERMISKEELEDLEKKALSKKEGYAYKLFSIYWYGIELPYHKEKALYWYERVHADKISDPEFECHIGKLYLYGGRGDSIDELGIQWLMKSAKKGHVGAKRQLGLYFEEQDNDLKEAAKWYLLAADQADSFSIKGLVRIYLKNRNKAILKSLEEKANEGNIEMQYQLGKIYEASKQTKTIREKKMNWYQLAANRGHINAMIALGIIYSSRRGVHENMDEAIKWLEKAVKRKSEEAMFALGNLYYEKIKDKEKAMFWYKKASRYGSLKASRKLREISREKIDFGK